MSLATETLESVVPFVVPPTQSVVPPKPSQRDNEGQRRDNEKTSMSLQNTRPHLRIVDKGTTRDNEIPVPDTSRGAEKSLESTPYRRLNKSVVPRCPSLSLTTPERRR